MLKGEAEAVANRALKIAQELSEEGIRGYTTAVAIISLLLSGMPKVVADIMTDNLVEEIRNFPGYPK